MGAPANATAEARKENEEETSLKQSQDKVGNAEGRIRGHFVLAIRILLVQLILSTGLFHNPVLTFFFVLILLVARFYVFVVLVVLNGHSSSPSSCRGAAQVQSSGCSLLWILQMICLNELESGYGIFERLGALGAGAT
ncbi:hypothetical protein D9619_003894 [Psilocybe cf. subviscida]|uniref:Uncharacterized protein n=1 Tax=Psilocybe cf. subviscida TaxID=2480587 RepID=A0A8H5BQA7_9AGAR|nr:hypothetical protein D9619_003894 [Psilocybe cf. subviscida]